MARTAETKSITYIGFADLRMVGANDFRAAGVENQLGVEFRKGQPKDVPVAVADALLTNLLFAGEFEAATPKGA